MTGPRFALALVAALFATPNLTSQSLAQEYPTRSIRIIVPFGAGGPADVTARLIGNVLQENFGQPFVVENRTGAGGVIGTLEAAKSPPDGYTLLMMSNTQTANESLVPTRKYELMRDLAPIAPVNYSDLVIVVHPSVPAKTLAEFIALAKRSPGAMNFGSGGSGTSNHLAGELFNIVAGVKLVHVPYKGVNLAMNDVISGQVQAVVIGIPAAAPHIKSGRLRALAVITPQRSPALPDVPTTAEAGLPNFIVNTWYGLLAPAGTPRPIITQLNAELARIMHAPDLKDRLAAMAAEPTTGTPEEFAEFIKREMTKWGDVVREAGLKAD